MEEKKVFISYCWTNQVLVDWVRDLATNLAEHGLDVVLDQWDLKEGHDVYKFMEQMVNAPDIDKVLIICDKGYAGKANERKGGVGTETQIITPEVYDDATQEKFIPIIYERDEAGKHYIPTYLASRKYIDLSSENDFFLNFNTLLRVIYERPLYRKPKKGTPPSFLFEDEQINSYKFSFILKQIQHNVAKGKIENIKSNANEFKYEFINSLKEFEVDKSRPRPFFRSNCSRNRR
ncbi:hypothetical protein M769_0124665 [Bacillus haynesii]|nr:hypothetical protein M769_0124665 [Bacillus haynesii]